MEAIFYILIVLTVFMSAVYVFKSNGQTGIKSLVFKVISSFMFTAVALYACFLNQFVLGTFVFLLGFVASCFGDTILGLPGFPELKEKKNKLILFGGLAFAVAHVAYYIGMILIFGWVWWSLLIALPFALFFFLFTKFAMKVKYDKMTAGILIYALFISIVVCQGLYAFISLPISVFSILIALGFLFFYVSDIILMKVYFGENSEAGNIKLYYYNLASYYIAQILLAVSLFFVVL